MTLNLQVHCPYCKRPVAAPVAMVGQRIMCPSCRAEIVLNPTALLAPAAAGRGPAEQAKMQPPVAPVPPPVATHYATPTPAPPAGQVTAPPIAPLTPHVLSVPVPPLSGAVATAPPVSGPPPVRSNTAQFLAAAPQTPAIASAADGKLPALQLADSPESTASSSAETQSPPIPLWLALMTVVASTLISLLLMTHDFDGSQAAQTTKAEARKQLTAFYGDNLTPLSPFQVHLREAQLAHSRGDFAAERSRYRQVLALLRAEGRSKFDGLTGTPGGDAELARLLAILLAE
jgi:hypothetical protein